MQLRCEVASLICVKFYKDFGIKRGIDIILTVDLKRQNLFG